jgi:uncharacterized Zn finger protein (UPF0148 family)
MGRQDRTEKHAAQRNTVIPAGCPRHGTEEAERPQESPEDQEREQREQREAGPDLERGIWDHERSQQQGRRHKQGDYQQQVGADEVHNDTIDER